MINAKRWLRSFYIISWDKQQDASRIGPNEVKKLDYKKRIKIEREALISMIVRYVFLQNV